MGISAHLARPTAFQPISDFWGAGPTPTLPATAVSPSTLCWITADADVATRLSVQVVCLRRITIRLSERSALRLLQRSGQHDLVQSLQVVDEMLDFGKAQGIVVEGVIGVEQGVGGGQIVCAFSGSVVQS